MERRGIAILALALAGVWLGPESARAEGRAVADSTGSAGAGTSRWGVIEAPTSANTAAPASAEKASWARIVDFPYQLVFLPVKVVGIGIEETVGLFETDLGQRLLHLFPLSLGPTLVTPSVGYSSQDGFGAGVALEAPSFLREDGRLKIGLAGTTRGQGKATLGAFYPRTEWSWVEVGAGYRSNINARFFGLGPSSDNSSRESFFREEMSWVGFSLTKRLFGSLSYQIAAHYSGVSATGTNESESPQLSREFEEELVTGSIPELSAGYRDRSDGPTVAFELRYDDTKILDRPESGGIVRGRVSFFQEKGDDTAEFWNYRAEIQRFVPLWFSTRALALRAFFSYLDEQGSAPIPFQRLLTNDDPDLFRGYTDARFRDRGLWAASAEYRWPLWSNRQIAGVGIDAYAFVDVGQVFHETGEATDDITTSWGGGLRLGGFGDFTGRIEIGKSDEGTMFRLRGDQIFQFAKSGLFHGRNPVPER